VHQYVEDRDGGYYIKGSRVSLDSVVYSFLRGESPEGIVESYPALSLEQVLGSLTFYLSERDAVEAYLLRERAEFSQLRDECREKNPRLYAALEAARRANDPAA
jgi:uncharacterized protein (DUF433 family)